MYVKKIFFVFILLFLLEGMLFSDDFAVEDINGVWLTPEDMNDFLSNSYDRRVVLRGLLEDWLIFRWDKTAKEGIFQRGLDRDTILSVTAVGKRVTIKYFYRDGGYESEMVLEYISRNLFSVVSNPFNGKKIDRLCRISDFSKKPQAKGRINNYGVRLRNRSELTSDIWFNLDFEEKVEILGISEKKHIIGELESYWYEVRVNFPDFGGGSLDGWVFGAYLDVANRTELEEKLKKLRRDGG